MANTKIISAPLMIALRLTRQLWLRVALMALLAVLASVSAMLFDGFIPQSLRSRFTPDAVMPILTILASGMLAVSTFSLNVMVTAHNAAASQATPRVHRILLGDPTTQTVLATFIGAFVFALSAIILFKSRLYPPGASVIMLGVTVFVVVLVILAMLRWIDHLSDLGSMDATLRAAEAEARSSLKNACAAPALGAIPVTDDTVMPVDTTPIRARNSGYLQLIDMSRLNKTLTDANATAYLHSSPGDFVLAGQTVGHAAGVTDEQIETIEGYLTFGQHRTFEQDSGYGLLVLSEIASRALSPGINDPGTAIAAIARQEKLLWEWAHATPADPKPHFDRVFVSPITAADLIDASFSSTARDGAGMIEVAIRLQRALRALARCDVPGMAEATERMSDYALSHAEKALEISADKEALKTAARPNGSFSPSP